MAHWFLLFMIYSFFGYCLEKLFAYVSQSDRQVRKCFLLLPLCPVYGLAMTALIALTPTFDRFLSLALTGGVVCTLAEYVVHLFYDKMFGVWFWDYSRLRGNVKGRICPQFAMIWGLLSALAVRYIHPVITTVIPLVSPATAFFLWITLAIDCVLTSALLARYHDTELLSLSVLLSSVPPASPEHRGRRTDGSSH